MFTFYEDYSCGQKSTEALIKKINNQKGDQLTNPWAKSIKPSDMQKNQAFSLSR